jgi:hypothetical protein
MLTEICLCRACSAMRMNEIEDGNTRTGRPDLRRELASVRNHARPHRASVVEIVFCGCGWRKGIDHH